MTGDCQVRFCERLRVKLPLPTRRQNFMGKFKKDNVNNRKQIKYREQKLALLIVWTIITLIITIVILFPFFADRQTVLKNAPTCISKSQFNVECSLCGMTRAFIEISNGSFSNAIDLNRGSIVIFFTFALNFFIFIFYLIFKLRSTKIIDDT